MARSGARCEDPEPARRTLHWRYLPLPDTPADVRGRVRVALAGWGVVGQGAEDVVQVVSELVTNAVEHAGTPLTVALGHDGDRVRVRVRDRSPDPPVLRPAEDDPRRGWGLRMVAQLACWGWDPHSDGKTVWATIGHRTRGLRSVRP